MKTVAPTLPAIIALLTLGPTGSAQTTVFTNADSANSLVSTPGNWSAGLPTGGVIGYIGINATADSNVSLSGYQVIHTNGVFSHTGLGAVPITGGSTWRIDGDSASTSTGFRGFSVQGGSSFTLQKGTVNTTAARDWEIKNTGSSMTINGGTVNFGRSVVMQGTAGTLFTINAGSAVGTGAIGGNNIQDNNITVTFNGGTTTFGTIDLRGDRTFFIFGGSSTGSLTATGLNGGTFGAQSYLNFLPGTGMSLTLSGTAGFAETFWDTNRLLYNGQSKTALGKTWAQVTAPGGLGGGAHFVFDGNTLSLGKASGGTVVAVR